MSIEELATMLGRQMAEAQAEAWDEGYEAGYASACAVNPEWPKFPTNPYRQVAA